MEDDIPVALTFGIPVFTVADNVCSEELLDTPVDDKEVEPEPQIKLFVADAVAVGSALTTTLALPVIEAVHPVVVLVATTVYVPAEV